MKSWILISYLVLLSPVLATTVISFDKNTDNSTTLFSGSKNSVIEVPVWIINSDNLSDLSLFIIYDGEIITPEKITKGVDELEYVVYKDEIKTQTNFNENRSGDFLLMNIDFLLTGQKGESTTLIFEVASEKNEFDYILINGIVDIEKDEENTNPDGGDNGKDSGEKIDSDLRGLIISGNPTEYAEKNNLEFEDGKIKVVIETNDSKEEKFVSIDELNNLTNNDTITRISPYREIPIKEIIIILTIIILLIILILKLRR